jgi:hypothetical protein
MTMKTIAIINNATTTITLMIIILDVKDIAGMGSSHPAQRLNLVLRLCCPSP